MRRIVALVILLGILNTTLSLLPVNSTTVSRYPRPLSLSLCPLARSTEQPSLYSARVSHDSIYIRNDTDLLRQAAVERWPGAGTPDNPIIISNYIIDASQATEGCAGIHIENTALYVRIENCEIYGGRPAYKGGIFLYNTTHVTIVNVYVCDDNFGIDLQMCSDSALISCTVERSGFGYRLRSSDSCACINCTALYIEGAFGFLLERTQNCTLAGCSALNNAYGICICVSNTTRVEGCWILDNTRDGLRIEYSTDCLIYNNFVSNDVNVYVFACSNLRFNITRADRPNIVEGPQVGGNYWSNYTGSDSDNDGFGDTPYEIVDAYNGTVFYDYLPLVPPPFALYLVKPQSGAILPFDDVYFRWVCVSKASALDHFEVRIYNASWDSGWNYFGTATECTAQLADGCYTVNVTAHSTAGDIAYDTAVFTVDTTPPTVRILEPANNTTLDTTTVTIRWRGNDTTSGLNYYLLHIYSKTWDSGWIRAGLSTSYTLSLSPNTYTVEIRAADRACNAALNTTTFTILPSQEQPPPEETPPSDGGGQEHARGAGEAVQDTRGFYRDLC